MIGARWTGGVVRLLVLGSMVSAAGCASVEYRVPTWEVQRLTQIPPTLRGGEVRVIPANAVVPPPPAPVAVAPAPPPDEVAVGPGAGVDVDVDVDVDVPVVVAAGPGPRPIAVRRPVGALASRPAPPAGGSWRPASTRGGGWRPAGTPARPSAPRVGSGGGGHHGGGGGGSAAGAAAGVAAAVVLVAIVAEAAANAAAADAARRYDGWVAVDAAHPLRLFYGGNQWRVVPLWRLAPADLIGLQYAALDEGDGPVQPLRPAPLPLAVPPRPPPIAPPPPALVPPSPPAAVAMQPPAPASPPTPVPQAIDSESP